MHEASGRGVLTELLLRCSSKPSYLIGGQEIGRVSVLEVSRNCVDGVHSANWPRLLESILSLLEEVSE